MLTLVVNMIEVNVYVDTIFRKNNKTSTPFFENSIQVQGYNNETLL